MDKGGMSYSELLQEARRISSDSHLELQFGESCDQSVAERLQRMMNEGQFRENITTWALLHDISKYGWRQNPEKQFVLTVGKVFDFHDFQRAVLPDLVVLKVTAG